MLKSRWIKWDIFCAGEYVLVDETGRKYSATRGGSQWATEAGLSVEEIGANQQFHLCDQTCDIDVRLECADVFDFIQKNEAPADLLIAHAFLDLLPLPESLTGLLSLTKNTGLACTSQLRRRVYASARH